MPLIHEKPIAISEAHLDSFGHLNHARYFELFEQARWDIITERGFGIETINRTKTGPVILEDCGEHTLDTNPDDDTIQLVSARGSGNLGVVSTPGTANGRYPALAFQDSVLVRRTLIPARGLNRACDRTA